MSRHDRALEGGTNLGIVGPLTSVALERVQRDFVTWALSPASRDYRLRRTDDGWRRVPANGLEDAARASILRVADDVGTAGIEAVVRSHEYTALGVVLVVTPRFAAVGISHYFGDGAAGLPALRAILSGGTEPRPRMTRWPLLRAALHRGLWRPSELRAGRALWRSMGTHLASAPLSEPGEQTDPARLRLTSFTVRVDGLRERALHERRASGVPLSTLDVLTGTMFRALRACLPDGADIPVRSLVGLRQHLPDGVSTTGSFFTNVIVGTLRDREWSAVDVAAALGALATSRTVLASHAVEVAAHTVARLRRTHRTAGGAPIMLTYSVLTSRLGASRDDFVPGQTGGSTMLMVNRGPLMGPHCAVTATGTDFLITVSDDSRLLDLDRLEQEFVRELRIGNSPVRPALGSS